MYLRRFVIENIRSISHLTMDFERGSEPGWHVILGPNGAGKSSVIRSLALLCMGEKEAYAARQDFSRWLQREQASARIAGTFSFNRNYDTISGGGYPSEKPVNAEVTLEAEDDFFADTIVINYSGERVNRTIWGSGTGWFSASFGPFRRFTGGDRMYDRLFVSNRRLAPHLTALGEDVALTEALNWLTSLHIQSLQDDKNKLPYSQAREILNLVMSFINENNFLPHDAVISEVTNEHVFVRDGNGNYISIDSLSDGYRSALSLVFELVRQMFELYGSEVVLKALRQGETVIALPGVVAIDEIDAHLHPTWQQQIGKWLTTFFPMVQFIVTTHSPIICRAIVRDDGTTAGSIWKLPVPGSPDQFHRVRGEDFDQLVYGNVLDAYSTELFGQNVTRSSIADELVERLASLNTASLTRRLSDNEQDERRKLRRMFPAEATSTFES